MMTTLLKHEWFGTRALLGIIMAAAPLLAGLGTLLTATGWPLISPLGTLLALLSITGLIPVLQLALAVTYWRSSYSRIGYFTQALPLRGSSIYWAKLIWTVIVTLVGLIITIGLALLFWPVAASQIGAERNPFTIIGQLWSTLQELSSPWTLGLIIGLLLVMLLIWPVHYFFAASIGSEAPLNRLGLGGPILVYLGLYMVMQIAAFVGLFALPWGVGVTDGSLGIVSFNFIDQLEPTIGVSTTEVMPIGFLPAIILVTLICLWRTNRSWNHKVSLV